MSKSLAKKSLIAANFVLIFALTAVAGAQVSEIKILPAPSVTNQGVINATPTTITSPNLPAATVSSNTATGGSMATNKCGVNSFSALNECGVGAFKKASLQCYDGHEEILGDETSCKSSETWVQYAKEICVKRCGIIKEQPTVVQKPLPVSPVQSNPISVCYISNNLTDEYNSLILELNKAESLGNEVLMNEIKQKIISLKEKITQNQKECTNTVPSTSSAQPTEATRVEAQNKPTAVSINRCDETIQWENKIDRYKKLSNLNDEELKKENGFSREEINNILKELADGLEKVKEQCQTQNKTAVSITNSISVMSGTASAPSIIEQVKPVIVDSGQEITDYYRTTLEKVSATADTETQVNQLKALRGEIDQLISKLIKSRKEIEASEFNNLVTEVTISKGEIKADNMAVPVSEKKILIDVNKTPMTIEPTATQVILQDKNISVETKEVSIQNGLLMVGNNEVKVAPSQITEKLNISPTNVELKTENEKAVYVIKTDESRKLFGFISIKVTNTVTADATSGEVLKQQLPWFSFFTTKSK